MIYLVGEKFKKRNQESLRKVVDESNRMINQVPLDQKEADKYHIQKSKDAAIQLAIDKKKTRKQREQEEDAIILAKQKEEEEAIDTNRSKKEVPVTKDIATTTSGISNMFDGMKDFFIKYNTMSIKKPDTNVQDAYIHKSGKTIGISEEDNILVRKDMKKVNQGENKQTVVSVDNKELIKTVNMLQASIDKLSNSLSAGQKIMLTDTDGSYIGKGLMQKARG